MKTRELKKKKRSETREMMTTASYRGFRREEEQLIYNT